jgi:pyruvate/2-oxoglutarate dehydrogenase complex dihydrolipoamide acyltransferase (E2) component
VYEVRLPQWGMGMDEGTVISWSHAPGDTVAQGDVLGLIEAAKVETELESPVGGPIAEIRVAEGETVPVGATLIVIDQG